MIDKLVMKVLSLKARLSEERGQDLMEYALITGGIGIALLAGMAIVSPSLIESWFQALADAIEGSIIQ